jgi:hypothetical protein
MQTKNLIFGLIGVAAIGFGSIAHSQQSAAGNDDELFIKGALEPAGDRQNLACRAGMLYSKLIEEKKYDAVGGIFADDAIYAGPNDDPMKGAKRIGEFYKIFLTNAKPRSKIATLVPAGSHDCYMELIGTSNGYTMPSPGALDRFTTDDSGKVTQLTIFFRPRTAQGLMSAAAPALDKHP